MFITYIQVTDRPSCGIREAIAMATNDALTQTLFQAMRHRSGW